MPTLTTTMHKTVTDYAVPRGIKLRCPHTSQSAMWRNWRGDTYETYIQPGYYYLVDDTGYLTHMSLAPTAKSAINMMKRYCR